MSVPAFVHPLTSSPALSGEPGRTVGFTLPSDGSFVIAYSGTLPGGGLVSGRIPVESAVVDSVTPDLFAISIRRDRDTTRNCALTFAAGFRGQVTVEHQSRPQTFHSHDQVRTENPAAAQLTPFPVPARIQSPPNGTTVPAAVNPEARASAVQPQPVAHAVQIESPAALRIPRDLGRPEFALGSWLLMNRMGAEQSRSLTGITMWASLNGGNTLGRGRRFNGETGRWESLSFASSTSEPVYTVAGAEPLTATDGTGTEPYRSRSNLLDTALGTLGDPEARRRIAAETEGARLMEEFLDAHARRITFAGEGFIHAIPIAPPGSPQEYFVTRWNGLEQRREYALLPASVLDDGSAFPAVAFHRLDADPPQGSPAGTRECVLMIRSAEAAANGTQTRTAMRTSLLAFLRNLAFVSLSSSDGGIRSLGGTSLRDGPPALRVRWNASLGIFQLSTVSGSPAPGDWRPIENGMASPYPNPTTDAERIGNARISEIARAVSSGLYPASVTAESLIRASWRLQLIDAGVSVPEAEAVSGALGREQVERFFRQTLARRAGTRALMSAAGTAQYLTNSLRVEVERTSNAGGDVFSVTAHEGADRVTTEFRFTNGHWQWRNVFPPNNGDTFGDIGTHRPAYYTPTRRRLVFMNGLGRTLAELSRE